MNEVVIYVLDGGLNNDRDRLWRFGGYTLTQAAGERACENHAQESGYGEIAWTRDYDQRSIGYTETTGYEYSVRRVVVNDRIEE